MGYRQFLLGLIIILVTSIILALVIYCIAWVLVSIYLILDKFIVTRRLKRIYKK